MILVDSTLLRMAAYFIESLCFYYDFLLWNEKKYEEKRNIFPFFFAVIRKSSTFAALFRTMEAFGRLAQLVQSICLTSRGSAVRIRQRPQRGSLGEPLFFVADISAFFRRQTKARRPPFKHSTKPIFQKKRHYPCLIGKKL